MATQLQVSQCVPKQGKGKMFELLCMMFASVMFGMNVSIPFVSFATERRQERRVARERVNRTNSRESLR
jgi:ABC-type phosphate/phosphonate transport system permease subunit